MEAAHEVRKIEGLIRRLPALSQTADTLYVGETRSGVIWLSP